MDEKKLMIVDGNSILNRAFYGISTLLMTSDGVYTNGIYGFINIIQRYIEEEDPQYLCIAFDLKTPTFRHKMYEGYKAKRRAMPIELSEQVPILKEVLDAMNIKRLEREGFEADDILGSISQCAQNLGITSVLVTGDRDAFQLLGETTRLKLPRTRGGKTTTEEYDHRRIVEVYGIEPDQFVDVKALMGDASDNIPGVPGIGEKTALKIIREFGSLDNLYNSLDMIKGKKIKENLEKYKEQAYLSKKLSKIDRSMTKLCDFEDLKRKEIDKEQTAKIFKKLEFKSLIEKFDLDVDKTQTDINIDIHTITCIKELNILKEEMESKKEIYIYHLIDRIDKFTQKLASIVLSCKEGQAYYVDLTRNIDEEQFLQKFESIFENNDIKKYGHDFKSFLVYLNNKGIDFKGLAFDTMIAAYIINPSKDTYTVTETALEFLDKNIASVEELAGRGKNFTFFKDMPHQTLSELVGVYPRIIEQVSQKTKKILCENDQKELYFDIELPLIKVLADMEHYGFKVDVGALVEFSRQLDGKIDTIRKEIYSLAGEEFNINSPKQLGVILFEKLGLPVVKKNKTGYSTDVTVLEELYDRHKIIPQIHHYRQLVKLKTTYAKGLLSVIDPTTGKIHSSFNQTSTVTGRISSTEPNLQNIPIRLDMGRKIRKVFIPSSDDSLLLDADYSQIELRVLAHITNDENMINAFLEGKDIHTLTASKVFDTPIEEVTPIMRDRAKAVNFGIIYGIGDFSLAKDIGITRKEARKYIDSYLDRYPNVRQYMQDAVEMGKEHGFVSTMFNRRRYLPELKSRNYNIRSFGERIAVNTSIQGSAADIIKIAMVKVHKELRKRKLKSRLILQVHDELIIEAPAKEVEEVKNILLMGMQNAVQLKVPLVAKINLGSNWYETK